MRDRDVKTPLGGPIIMAATEERIPGERDLLWTNGDGKALDPPQPCVVVRKSSYEEYNQYSPISVSQQLLWERGYFYFYEVTTD